MSPADSARLACSSKLGFCLWFERSYFQNQNNLVFLSFRSCNHSHLLLKHFKPVQKNLFHSLFQIYLMQAHELNTAENKRRKRKLLSLASNAKALIQNCGFSIFEKLHTCFATPTIAFQLEGLQIMWNWALTLFKTTNMLRALLRKQSKLCTVF